MTSNDVDLPNDGTPEVEASASKMEAGTGDARQPEPSDRTSSPEPASSSTYSPSASPSSGPTDSAATPAKTPVATATPEADRFARRTGRGRPKWLWPAIALAIIIIILAAAVLSIENQPDYVSVEQAVTSPEKYMDHEVQVFGTVEEWNPSSSDHRFNLNDTESTDQEFFILAVDANGVPAPSSFGEHKGATVTGRLVYDDNNELKLVATELRVGCPSKYEPDEM